MNSRPPAEIPADDDSAQGYGECSKCGCKGFEADWRNNRICGRCGHSYEEHW